MNLFGYGLNNSLFCLKAVMASFWKKIAGNFNYVAFSNFFFLMLVRIAEKNQGTGFFMIDFFHPINMDEYGRINNKNQQNQVPH